MWISRVEIENFMPFRGKYEQKFSQDELVGIIGEYEEEEGRSNRAGKSSYIEAIVWCLYGNSRAKKDVELIHHGTELMSVSVELHSDANTTYTITRTRDSKNKGTLEIKGKEGNKKKATQGMIDKIVGMNSGEFEFTAFFRQNDIDQFMEADPQSKKQLLMKWIQQTDWSVYAADADVVKKEFETEKERLVGVLGSLPETFDLAGAEVELKKIGDSLKKLEGEAKKVSDERIKLEMQRQELDKLESKRGELAELVTKINRLRDERPDWGPQKARMEKLAKALEREIPLDKIEEAKSKHQTGMIKLGEVCTHLREKKAALERSAKDMTGTCPVLNEACDRIKMSDELLKREKEKIAELVKKQKHVEDVIAKCDRVLRLADNQKTWKHELQSLQDKEVYVGRIDAEILELQKKGKALQSELPTDLKDRKAAIQEKLAETNRKAELVNNTMSQLHTQRGGILEAKERLIKEEKRRKSAEKELKQVDQKIADAKYVSFMFGKNGIPSMELENSFSEIEDDANLILSRLGAPFTFEFQATRELGTWETTCLACGYVYERGFRGKDCPKCGVGREKQRRDELSLRILENGDEKAFYMDSGGGKVLLSVAIRVALTLLARRRTGTEWNVLFLDEVFGQLDKVNRQNLAELIVGTLKRDLGFDQVMMISHDREIQSSTANSLKILKHAEGWSEPVWMN